MANNPFIVDNTIPGLGASDLANMVGATYVLGFGALSRPAHPNARPAAQPIARRSLWATLRNLGRKAN